MRRSYNLHSEILNAAFAVMLVACQANVEFSSPQKKAYDANAIHRSAFLASEVIEGKEELYAGGRYGSTEITMRDLPATTVSQKQVDRTMHSISKRQGHDSVYRAETFAVSQAGVLDLLIVIDDSRSMTEEQAELGKKLGPLLSAIQNTSWQIAVVSTSDPCVNTAGLIKPTDTNIEKKFAKAVKMSRDLAATEQGFPMAIQALQAKCGNQKAWTRPNSALGVLVVSDEDNCGSDAGEQSRCDNILGKNADEMVNFLHTIRPADLARVYGIVKQDSASCPEAAGVGVEYLRAVSLTGGVSGSICSVDYTDSLNRISADVSKIVKREFQLTATPDMVQFVVKVDGVVVPTGWSVSGDRVVLTDNMVQGASSVTFEYSHGSMPKFDRLALTASVASGSLAVKYSGTLQPNTAYTYTAQTGEVIFNPMPPEDAIVDVEWREDISLLGKFPFAPNGFRADTLEVFVDGAKAESNQYTYAGGFVEFASPPADGAEVTFKYKTESHKITDYMLSPKRAAQSVTARDAATGAEIPMTLVHGRAVFSPGDVQEGRKVQLVADYGAKPETQYFELPETAIPGTLQILVDDKLSACDGKDADETQVDEDSADLVALMLEQRGTRVRVTCPLDSPDYERIAVQYRYETPRLHEFTVSKVIPLNDSTRPVGWKVWVNGIETTKFTRRDRTIILEDSVLSPGAKVEVDAIIWQKVEN